MAAAPATRSAAGMREHGRLLVDQLLLHQVAGDLQAGAAGALAGAGLQHVELALLDGELDVLHFLEVVFEDVLDAEQFLVDLPCSTWASR